MPYLKMLWQTESPTPQIGSWDFWTSINGFISDLGITKTNNGIAYYAAIHTTSGDDKALLISPSSSAVEYNGYTQHGYIVDVNNITWWINAKGTISNYDSACLLSDTVYGDMTDAARDLVSKIYAVPFHEDYQVGQYVLNRADKVRTVRKVLGLWLAFTVSNYSSPNVQYISDNADTIINDIVTKLSASTDFRIYMYARYNEIGRGVYINVYYGNNVSGITASIIQKSIYRGLEYYNIGATTPQPPFTNLYSLYVNYGTPTTTETTGTYYFQTIGIYSTNLYNKDITNMGIDL